jgi:hypothetical protein
MKKFLVSILFIGTLANASFFDSIMNSVSGVSSEKNESDSLISEVKQETGLSTTQATGAIGALMGYAQNNISPNDYSTITDKVPGLSSYTSSPMIAPIVSSLTSSDMVKTTLKGFGVEPSMVTTIVPIVINYVSSTAGESSGNILSSALLGLVK